MANFFNNFFGSLNRLIDIIKSFPVFIRFLAFMLTLTVLLIIMLAVLKIIDSYTASLFAAGLFALLLLMIFMTYQNNKRETVKTLQTGNVTIHVHEAGNPTNWLAGAEVRVALPRPELFTTDSTGIARCIFTGETRGKKYWVTASKAGYQPAKQEARMADGEVIRLGLQPDPAVSAMRNILSVLKGSSLEISTIKTRTKLSDATFDEAVDNLLSNDYVRRSPTKLFITDEGKSFLNR